MTTWEDLGVMSPYDDEIDEQLTAVEVSFAELKAKIARLTEGLGFLLDDGNSA